MGLGFIAWFDLSGSSKTCFINLFFCFLKSTINNSEQKHSLDTSWERTSFTNLVIKRHRQSNHLDKSNALKWFSSHTFWFSGKFYEFFDEPGGMGRISSIF